MTKHTDFEGKRRHTDPAVKRLKVLGVRYVPTPNADGRFCKAIHILLEAAARYTSQSKESTNAKKKEEDAPAGGGEGDSHE